MPKRDFAAWLPLEPDKGAAENGRPQRRPKHQGQGIETIHGEMRKLCGRLVAKRPRPGVRPRGLGPATAPTNPTPSLVSRNTGEERAPKWRSLHTYRLRKRDRCDASPVGATACSLSDARSQSGKGNNGSSPSNRSSASLPLLGRVGDMLQQGMNISQRALQRTRQIICRTPPAAVYARSVAAPALRVALAAARTRRPRSSRVAGLRVCATAQACSTEAYSQARADSTSATASAQLKVGTPPGRVTCPFGRPVS